MFPSPEHFNSISFIILTNIRHYTKLQYFSSFSKLSTLRLFLTHQRLKRQSTNYSIHSHPTKLHPQTLKMKSITTTLFFLATAISYASAFAIPTTKLTSRQFKPAFAEVGFFGDLTTYTTIVALNDEFQQTSQFPLPQFPVSPYLNP